MHALSDGTDGHTRVFFTHPSDPTSLSGQLFMRTDERQTVQLNASERTTPDTTNAPATYLDASANGERVFFMTGASLTNDAPEDGHQKIYMYDTTKPAGSNLTFLTPDNEQADGTGSAQAMLGASADGHYAFLIVNGQLVSGQPSPPTGVGIYLWHDGTLSYVGPATDGEFQQELWTGGKGPGFLPRQARVTPDGRFLLFPAESGVGLTGYDQGVCDAGHGCRELYLYSADSGRVVCVSCNPSGAAATVAATDQVRFLNGASQTSVHQNEAITDDGSRVFFTTAEALVPEDVNGKSDAYEYDVATGTLHLLSTGTSTDDSWFMDASSNGDDAFIVTSQVLVGWDRDQAYDLYDARVNGGWSEPSPAPVPCVEEACRGVLTGAPSPLIFGSGSQSSGNPVAKTRNAPVSSAKRLRSCPKGKRLVRVRGRVRCVKQRHRRVLRQRGGK